MEETLMLALIAAICIKKKRRSRRLKRLQQHEERKRKRLKILQQHENERRIRMVHDDNVKLEQELEPTERNQDVNLDIDLVLDESGGIPRTISMDWSWRARLRMDGETYSNLLSMVSPFIKKQNTVMKAAISAQDRLHATLKYLVTGASYVELKTSLCMSSQVLSRIIPATCRTIYKVLKKDYLKFPDLPDDWIRIANGFEEKWNFPHCVGIISGKLFTLSPSHVALLAVVNARYELMYFKCDFESGKFDGSLLEDTDFYRKIYSKSLGLPEVIVNESESSERKYDVFQNNSENNGKDSLPYVFIGDDTFTLRDSILKPYKEAETQEEHVFNQRLCKTRKVVENMFDILISRFGLFQKPIKMKRENIETVFNACCVLHNYLLEKCGHDYLTEECFDRLDPHTGVVSPGLLQAKRHRNVSSLKKQRDEIVSESARICREKYTKYFNGEGSISSPENSSLKKLAETSVNRL